MALKLTAQHIAAQGGAYEPQRANNAILYVPFLDGWGSDGADVTLSLESFPLPKENNAVIEARWMNERRKFAGPANVEDMEVVVKDFVDKRVAQVLLNWRRQVYNPTDVAVSNIPTGGVGLAKNYKKSGFVVLFAPDGSLQRQWKVEGLWPTSMDPGDIDMTSEDFIKMTITLSVDRISEAVLTGQEGFVDITAGVTTPAPGTQ